MGRIITEALVHEAIVLTRPAAKAILETPGATWGPKEVRCCAELYGLEKRVQFSFHGENENEEWKDEWKDPQLYLHIVNFKLDAVMRHKMNTSVIVALFPALLKEGEFLYAGGAYREGIGGASASGANGFADETIAEIFLANLNMLVQREKNHRIQVEMKEI